MSIQRAKETRTSADDASLVDRASKGAPDAVREIMLRYNRHLYRVARAVTGDDTEAEDICRTPT